MSSETERLAREAEERRSHLDSTLDQLKNRFTPGQRSRNRGSTSCRR